jgi:hypothetical protein
MRQMFNRTHPILEIHRFASAFLGVWPDLPVSVACNPQVCHEFSWALGELRPPKAWSNQLSLKGTCPKLQQLSIKNLSLCTQLLHRIEWLEDRFKSLSQSELDASSVISLHMRREGDDRLHHSDGLKYRLVRCGYWKDRLLHAMHGYASLFPSLQLSSSASPQSLPLAHPISVVDAMSEIALKSVQKMVENRAEANSHLLATAMHVHLQAGRREGACSPKYSLKIFDDLDLRQKTTFDTFDCFLCFDLFFHLNRCCFSHLTISVDTEMAVAVIVLRAVLGHASGTFVTGRRNHFDQSPNVFIGFC